MCRDLHVDRLYCRDHTSVERKARHFDPLCWRGPELSTYISPATSLRTGSGFFTLNLRPVPFTMNKLVTQYGPTRSSLSHTPDAEDEVFTNTEKPAAGSMNFALPSVSDPAQFLHQLTDVDSSNAKAKLKLAHGTTTLAFRFKGGIIVAVDSRATAGSYIASGTVKKVIEINPFLRERAADSS